MKNFALTLALLSAAVLSPAATPSPAHAADTLPAPAALSPRTLPARCRLPPPRTLLPCRLPLSRPVLPRRKIRAA